MQDLIVFVPTIGVIVAIATFFIGRQTAASDKGKESGAIKTDIGYIKESVGRIEKSVNRLDGRTDENSRQISDIGQSAVKAGEIAKSAHKRLDEHLERDHGKTVVK